jgi:5'-3' exonuclease
MDNLKHLVIDADQMVYACGFAAKGEPLSHSLQLINQRIAKSLKLVNCERYSVYIKGKGNFRDDIAMDYKATRSGDKPEFYDEIREFLQEVHEAELVNDMEADDKVSILLYQDYLANAGNPEKCTVVVSSPDKDLKNTPGWHLNPMKDDVYWVSEMQANRHFCYQLLAGDRVDNIPGLKELSEETRKKYGCKQKKVGEKTAKDLIGQTKGLRDAAELVAECYVTADVPYAYLKEQINLLWMTRSLDEISGEPVLGIEEKFPREILEHYLDLAGKVENGAALLKEKSSDWEEDVKKAMRDMIAKMSIAPMKSPPGHLTYYGKTPPAEILEELLPGEIMMVDEVTNKLETFEATGRSEADTLFDKLKGIVSGKTKSS